MQDGPQTAPSTAKEGRPDRVEPDLDFIRKLRKLGGDSYKKCMQCGTCSAVCDISPDREPFPRKEMIWAVWGMKDRLLKDPDVWLCHQCNDCTTNCPRDARPGDVLAAVRQEGVIHYAVPRFLARWVNQPKYAPLLLAVPAALLGLALVLREEIEAALGTSQSVGDRIVYSYSSALPRGVLNAFFMLFGVLALGAALGGLVRFWRAMKTTVAPDRIAARSKGLPASIVSTIKTVFMHQSFAKCTAARSRFASHSLVLFGFLALSMVTLWVITARYNPLIRADFVYPMNFWNPWKVLANAGGAALVVGCLLMIRDRLADSERAGASGYFDWILITQVLLVTITGFVTEAAHYLRLEPHRHVVYFIHLVFVFMILMYLPYSKLAHVVYRSAAMVFADYTGRDNPASTSLQDIGKDDEQEGKANA